MDSVKLGQFYSLDYLKDRGLLTAPSFLNMFNIAPVDIDINLIPFRLENDTSQVYQVTTKALSFSGDASLATNYNDDYRVRGKGFFANFVFDLAKSATVYYKIDPSLVDNQCFLLPLKLNSSKGPTIIRVYKGDNYEKGSAVGLFNANDNSLNVAKVTLNVATAPAVDPTKGTLFSTFLVGLAGNPVALTGGSQTGANFIILNKSRTYLIEIENLDTVNDAKIGLEVTEFEI